MMIVNFYHHVTNNFPYHSRCFLRCIPLLEVSHGEDRIIARSSCFFFFFFCYLAMMIVNFYHHVTNKFPYHSTCFEMYTVT